ncbi:hypothetical protein Daus18300_007358 [Diaporthe australafricana]|uniref:Acyl-protein thioesterase 1 n=1 Tax=Diaporthe australafricana TaxID=127596 RepID=A0ABR3WMW1_9PEZI
MLSKTKLKQINWPEPLVVHPTTAHTHSIILLHGRGSSAERFGLEILAAKSSANKSLAEHLPSAKIIFPTAKKRRSTVLKRIPINQWFDNFSLEDPSQRQHLQYDGISETSEFVMTLVNQEAEVVGMERVIVGGLSQGCAAALHVLLNSGGKVAMGGFVGMSGWLPFAETLDPTVVDRDDGHDEDNDIFGPDSDNEDETENRGSEQELDRRYVPLLELQRTAANTARDIASLPSLSAAQEVVFPSTPIFLGHGRNDEKVSVDLGEQARHVLESLGCKVRWRDYDEGHWYKVPEEIDDIVDFLQDIITPRN